MTTYEWANVAERLGLSNKPPPPAPPPPCTCDQGEPCSPDHFEAAGFLRAHFADFISALRGVPPHKQEVERHADGSVTWEALHADEFGRRQRWTVDATGGAA